MKTSELKRVLSANGCYFVSHGGRHDQWFSPITGKTFVVPRHDSQEIPKAQKKVSGRKQGYNPPALPYILYSNINKNF